MNPQTDDLIISNFSDVTQPPLEKEVYKFGKWEDLWTDYVRLWIHPELRSGVIPMTYGENYQQYCAKYLIVTPNDMRDTALHLCTLCGRKTKEKRKNFESTSENETDARKKKK